MADLTIRTSQVSQGRRDGEDAEMQIRADATIDGLPQGESEGGVKESECTPGGSTLEGIVIQMVSPCSIFTSMQ